MVILSPHLCASGLAPNAQSALITIVLFNCYNDQIRLHGALREQERSCFGMWNRVVVI